MIQDHMPTRLMNSLQKLFANHDSQKVQRCKTISSGSYSNLSNRFSRDHYSNNDLAARPLLSYQYNSNWSNDTLDRNLTTIAVQPTRQNQYEYPEMDFKQKPSISKNKEDLQRLGQYREKKKQIKKGSINEIIRKMKTIDLASDEWVGKAPLATPETLSETSSLSQTTNELILNPNASTNNKRNSLETVTETATLKAKSSDSVTIDIDGKEDDEIVKVDISLDIDVNALFDKLEKDGSTAKNFNLDKSVLDKFEERTKDQMNSQSSPSKFVKRTSSLKRNDSTSSSSKRVTFDTKTAVLNTGETMLLNKSFCRRSNSERINRRKIFTSSNNKNQKLKQRHENQLKDQLFKSKLKDLIKEPIKDRDQVDNELNEKLEELLGQNLSCSDTDLSKIGRSDEANSNNQAIIKVHVHNEQPSTTLATSSRSVQQHYSPIKQQIDSPMEDYSLGYVVSNMNLPVSQTTTSNESSPKKNVMTYQNFKDEDLDMNELYNKEQYERLFAKLSTIESIESPSIEDLDKTCDNKFKSDLNKIKE